LYCTLPDEHPGFAMLQILGCVLQKTCVPQLQHGDAFYRKKAASFILHLAECSRALSEAPALLQCPRYQAQASSSKARFSCLDGVFKAGRSCSNVAGGAMCSLAGQFSCQAPLRHIHKMAFARSFMSPFALQVAASHDQTAHPFQHPKEARVDFLAVF
jgi:hypothetical protein